MITQNFWAINTVVKLQNHSCRTYCKATAPATEGGPAYVNIPNKCFWKVGIEWSMTKSYKVQCIISSGLSRSQSLFSFLVFTSLRFKTSRKSHVASWSLQARFLRQGYIRFYVAPLEVIKGHINVLMFTSSISPLFYWNILCSVSWGCISLHVAFWCIKVQVLRQGCIRSYVAPLLVATSRLRLLKL